MINDPISGRSQHLHFFEKWSHVIGYIIAASSCSFTLFTPQFFKAPLYKRVVKAFLNSFLNFLEHNFYETFYKYMYFLLKIPCKIADLWIWIRLCNSFSPIFKSCLIQWCSAIFAIIANTYFKDQSFSAEHFT